MPKRLNDATWNRQIVSALYLGTLCIGHLFYKDNDSTMQKNGIIGTWLCQRDCVSKRKCLRGTVM